MKKTVIAVFVVLIYDLHASQYKYIDITEAAISNIFFTKKLNTDKKNEIINECGKTAVAIRNTSDIKCTIENPHSYTLKLKFDCQIDIPYTIDIQQSYDDKMHKLFLSQQPYSKDNELEVKANNTGEIICKY